MCELEIQEAKTELVNLCLEKKINDKTCLGLAWVYKLYEFQLKDVLSLHE